jgi:hypothetical protein
MRLDPLLAEIRRKASAGGTSKVSTPEGCAGATTPAAAGACWMVVAPTASTFTLVMMYW